MLLDRMQSAAGVYWVQPGSRLRQGRTCVTSYMHHATVASNGFGLRRVNAFATHMLCMAIWLC